jgi:CubicO group peptidase (beta-lactamase class C family)
MVTSLRFIVVLASGMAWLASMDARPAMAADPWTQVGTPSRPAWVAALAERRLRLLPALPGMKNTMQTLVAGAFGSQGPGMTVGLVLDDGLFYSQGFGFRDEAKQHKADELTVYRVGSLTKVVTAATLLTLVESHAVSLDDFATKYVPELGYMKLPGCTTPPCNNPIKLKHLPSHTSGLPNEMKPAEVDEAQWLSELQNTSLAFSPGSFSAYSGVGAEMEALIIKRVSNTNFDTYMKQHLLDPLGMVNTHLHYTNVPANLLAQKYKMSGSTYTADKTWDNPQMLIPAGNLFTNVLDFSHFMQMEISGNSNVLKKSTIVESQSVVIQATGLTPGPNCSGITDPSGASFSKCGATTDFGLGWYIGGPPFVQHNGAWGGVWSSQTKLAPKQGMGATGFVSTDPTWPASPAGFVGNVVNGFLTAGLSADNATDWIGKVLSIGVARVLYLSGKSPQASDLAAFTPQFVSGQKLSQANVVAYLKAWQSKHGHCSTFRVRDIESTSKIAVQFHCEKGNWATVLEVQGGPSYKIAWVDNVTPVATGPSCAQKCNTQEGSCMQQAHSPSERQQCIHEKQQCVAECK